jgi:hypothetical protein
LLATFGLEHHAHLLEFLVETTGIGGIERSEAEMVGVIDA